jgi:cation diffusion facilitator CzcD-associated flavoprotein CzcO/amino acid transporter
VDEGIRATARQFETYKRRRVLSTARIVFLVVAAAAPLAAMVGNLPIALARGNGAGLPGTFLFAGLTLFCFAVGYAAMSRRVVNTGAFYTYVAVGLGKTAGVGAAFTAVVAYVSYTIGLAAFTGYFVDQVMVTLGVHWGWLVYSAASMVVVAVLGYRSIDLSSKILGVLMAAEVAILALFDLSVVFSKGASAFPLASFAPSVVLTPGLGVGVMIAFTSFIGFESAALYGEESTTPTRSIPIATYISVVLTGVFYLLTSWVTVGAMGVDSAASESAQQGSLLMFNLVGRFSGQTVSGLMGVFVCTSLLATYLAMHNAAARYSFALSREKLLPAFLGRLNRYAPSNASATVSVATLLCVAAFGITGADPYLSGVPVLIGLGTLGIVFLQGFAAVAIVLYLGRRRAETHWSVLIAASLGAVGLAMATVLVASKFKLLAIIEMPGIEWLPLLYVFTVAGGVGFALWLKSNKPRTYSALAESDLRADSSRTLPHIQYEGKYCIVGAGPCGLLAARAFKLAGIPYDQFERHSDVGGIWDIDNPGSSMYESAHFISSKYTSGFFGLPMPKDYPDYPDHRQLLSYIRDFSQQFDLRARIRFNTEVKQAEPLGENAKDGWRVTLNNGESAVYKGIVCANGVTWHPSRPQYPGLDAFKGEVKHTVEYRSPASLAGKRVLIIGAGNSGVDIACDAARSASRALISLRRGYYFVPKHIFGVPTDVFLSGQVHPPKGVALPDDPSKMLTALIGDLTRYGLPAPDHKALESHPIMNTQILHYLAHGDLIAKGEVERFTEHGVRFQDGSTEEIDLVLFATGYEYKIPYLDSSLFTWKQGHPELYLNIFHRSLQGLSVVGFVEFASAGYQRFDEMAQMVAMDAYIRQSGVGLEEWTVLKRDDRPNLRGTVNYIDSPRHANYVEVGVYRRTLAQLREKFSWPDPNNALYAPLKREADPVT